MGSYNLRFNNDDSVIRHIIIGLLADLNSKVFFWAQTDADTRKKIEVPFFMSITGDEGWINDYFMFDDLEDPDHNTAIGTYEKLPRGIVYPTSMSIDSGSLLNKYVYGTYTKLEADNKLRSYRAQFQSIPVNMSFNCELFIDSQLDIFKVVESLIKKLYKSNSFNVDVGAPQDGTYRLASYYKMPEDFEQERPIEFGFTDKKEYKVTFTIEMLSFIPSIDFSTEMYSGNRMFNINNNTEAVPPGKMPEKSSIVGEVPGPDNFNNFHYGNNPPEQKLTQDPNEEDDN